MRKLLACLSAGGLAISLAAYSEGLLGATLDGMLPWMIALSAGAIAFHIPIFVLERSSLRDRTFYWKGFARGMPRWVVPLVKLTWLIVFGHFIWSLLESHGAAPAVKDGRWVLSNHGRIVKVLTQEEYLALEAEELRMFAITMIACYLVPMMYWWFPRKPRAARIHTAHQDA